MKKEYDNYIFDLYGTLIDLNVDKKKSELWNVMASLYSVYGCDYDPKEMMDVFFDMDKEERVSLKEKTGCRYPEIRIERVFARLLFECRRSHPVRTAIEGHSMDSLRNEYEKNMEKVISLVEGSDWCSNTANIFRILSRQYLKLFPGTIKTLQGLKERGKKVFLLSNAQAVFTVPEIEASGLKDCFDKMYISSDHYVMKPDTAFMNILIENEGLDRDRSVMVGDDPVNDASMAVLSDMDCILLNTSERGKKEIDDAVGMAVGYKSRAYGGSVTVINTISELPAYLPPFP